MTTWPERPYKGVQGVKNSSLSHPMQSGFAVTFHESIGGIRPDPKHPGFKKFVLQPCFLQGLDWAKTKYESIHGTISSQWKKEENQILWDVVIPEGTSSQVRLNINLGDLQKKGTTTLKPNGKVGKYNTFDLGSGKHSLIVLT